MSCKIQIREATIHDYPAVYELHELVDREFVPPLSERESLDERVRQSISAPDHSCLIEVGVPNTIRAALALQRFQAASESAYLKFFAVHPDHRSQGLGLAFRARALDLIRQMGIEEVQTRTWSTNSAMISLNKALGFILERIVPDDRSPGIDSVYFRKSL